MLDQRRAAAELERELQALGSVIVAFSGGADSAFLAVKAHQILGVSNVVCVTAVSPSLPQTEPDECAALAESWGLDWRTVHTLEMENAAYQVNDAMRCFHCKSALMDSLAPLLVNGAVAVLGVNLDDMGDHRPGQKAAQQAGARFPLLDAGYTKAMIRDASLDLGLTTWDKPAAACLASRIPYGTHVSVSLLSRVERAEAALHSMGFDAVRVRHYGDTARLEVPLEKLAQVIDNRHAVVTAVRDSGYAYVTLDLEGLRSGNLNTALDL